MGYFMARNLANGVARSGGAPLLVYNRTTSKAEKLVSEIGSEKVEIAASPGQLATECDIIITSLASDAAVKSIHEEFAKALGNVRAI
jgi:3-hydroxyisobutyrate dehydrogenase-like beta-hydroxyacid dehydrogenase